VESRLN
jgi:hypothetical protein